MCLCLPPFFLLLVYSLASCHPLHFSCPLGCCCPRPGILVLCESLGLHVLPRSVPLTTSALSVARNHLCNVDNVLWHYTNLQELSLGQNQLERFPRGLPVSLETLQLQENRITYITAGDLRNLRNLTRLDLEDNHIRAIQPGALRGLMRLRLLSLKGNQLLTLPSHLPASLTMLDVSANCISTLDLPSLVELVNLQVLRINSNCLRSVPEHAFDSLFKLRSIDLANNLWVCECEIMYLYRWLLTDRLQMATDLVCAAPLHMAHKLLLTLSVMAICPKLLRPAERLAPLNTSTASTEMPRNSCKRNLSKILGSTLKVSNSQNNSSLEGLSYEQCLILNATYLVPQSTQTPYSPATNEGRGCVDNKTKLQDSFISTLSPLYPTREAGTQIEDTPQMLSQSADTPLVILLFVLCVLTGLLLLFTLLLLKKFLWRNQMVAPLPSTVSNSQNSNS